MPAKKPGNSEPYFLVWCAPDGVNNGSADDRGELQGAEIASVVWDVPTGITKTDDNTDAVTIQGVNYPTNTVAMIWLEDGTDQVDYEIKCTITTDETSPRELVETMIVPVRV